MEIDDSEADVTIQKSWETDEYFRRRTKINRFKKSMKIFEELA